MGKHRANTRDWQVASCNEVSSHEAVPCLLRREEEILNSICAGEALPKLLSRICTALDCEIGNVVSLVSVLGDNALDFVAIAENAKQFGLYTFCSVGVIADNGEPLGILDMYSCKPKLPSPWEWKLIERAGYLAAIAIERENERAPGRNALASEIQLTRESFEKWPESSN